MKRAFVFALCAASLGANVLLFAHWRSLQRRDAPAPPAATIHTAPATTRATESSTSSWSHVATTATPADLAARLRAQGFPVAVVRAMVTARVRESFAARYQELLDRIASVPYWTCAPFLATHDPKLALARRSLDREVAEAVGAILGPETDSLDAARQSNLRRRYGELTPDKWAQLERIEADYRDLSAEVINHARGIHLPEDVEKLRLLEKEQRADFERLLTPEELENFDLRSSQTALRLRTQLKAFAPTEQEFRAAFRIEHALDLRFGTANTLAPEARRERAAAEQTLLSQLATTLGPARYAEYLRSTKR